MTALETLSYLWTWTPFLLEGFAWNLLIAVSAITFGTGVGCLLVWAQMRGRPMVVKLSGVLSSTFFKIPTVALMFYCAILLPQEISFPGSDTVYPFASWIKAALALSAAQIGFTSLNLPKSVKLWQSGNRPAALLFVPSWGSNLLITIIASSAASLVGVNEIVSRCNKVISATSNTDLMVPMYLYVSLFFLLFCYPLTLLMRKFKKSLTAKLVA
jgi:polar amino acid transport system permease protein